MGVETGHLTPGSLIHVLRTPAVALRSDPIVDGKPLGVDRYITAENGLGGAYKTLGFRQTAGVAFQGEKEKGVVPALIIEAPSHVMAPRCRRTLEGFRSQGGLADLDKKS
jgi:hypothetical protein